ncbi:MAG: EamA family transporter [Paracoccaceae bacterium]|nr:EamA family transporter [Paracoccaceae bacterium]
MSNVLFGVSFTFATALIVIVGDYALKLAADGSKGMKSWQMGFGVLMYAFSALFWFYAIKHVTLAQAGVAFSMITLLALCVMGALVFGETLSARDYCGIACALLAMVLILNG